MIKKIKTENLLDLKETIATTLFDEYLYPFEVLPHIKDYIIDLGKTLSLNEYDLVDKNIWISKKVKKIHPKATIDGPTIIGANTEIRPNAYIRGNVIIGDNCVIGNTTEIKNAILFNNVHAPHFNYIGDSILGYKAHLGAGVVLANLKSDESLIELKIDNCLIKTNLHKMGSIIGDNVEIGCNSTCSPGVIVGRNTNIYPLTLVRGYIEESSILKVIQSQELVKKR